MRRLFYGLIILCLCTVNSVCAQDWMNGYSYRKKITIDKSKVTATAINSGSATVKQDLVNFPLLIVLQDDDLIHRTGSCGNKITSLEGKDISFALMTSPSVPLNFQLEDYNPETGKLTCWVRIASLSANGTASAPTTLYFYYGSALLHDPFGANGINVWSGEFSRIWHLKQDIPPATCRDAQSGLSAKSLIGSPAISGSSFTDAKIGTGIRSGANSYLQAGKDTSSAFTISAWISVQPAETDQVIIANDSTEGTFRNGYLFKISPQGDLVLEFYRSRTVSQINVPLTLNGPAWNLLHIIISGTQLSVLINGIQKISINSLKMGSGGAIRIGTDKQNTAHYSGIMDEIRIQKAVKKTEWFRTQYVNQDNPTSFYTISEEEYNPSVFAKFNGTVNGLWNLPANWANGTVPGEGTNIIISENRVANTSAAEVLINKLIIKNGASLYLNGSLMVSCDVKVESGGQIKLNDLSTLKLGGDIVNNGSVLSSSGSGKLHFTGTHGLQTISGTGMIKVHQLENSQAARENQLVLNSEIQLSGYLQLKRGILNANGNLTLLAAATGTAALLPVQVGEAFIYGQVHVQQYIAGGFSPPATARNWRLLSSPVYNRINNSVKEYDVSAYKSSMFVTGPGGITNGFDASPLNSGTIYTHDQSLNGNLSQKYSSINNIQAKIPLGKGIYVFSRGSRNIPNAYLMQIEQKPFSNPDAYYITYTGEILTGELHMELTNKNTPEAGDGFNLLGNPYPATLLWGSLSKTNINPFIWQYDPLNKDYKVSAAANTPIPAGTAFFVRVKSGEASGSLTFSENAKYEETGTPAVMSQATKRNEKISVISHNSVDSAEPEYSLKIILGRGPFSQEYKVNFNPGKNNEVDDNDALKIAEGFVNISSWVKGVKLAIEERDLPGKADVIQLYTSAWDDGSYQLDISISDALRSIMDIKLADNHLKKEIRLNEPVTVHNFDLTKDEPENRFSILLSRKASSTAAEKKGVSIMVYPNPVHDRIFLRSAGKEPLNAQLVITDLLGKVVLKQLTTIHQAEISIDCSGLKKGLYLINIYQIKENTPVKSIKLIRM